MVAPGFLRGPRRDGFGGLMRIVWFLGAAAVVAVACEDPPPQDPSQTTYQNGYPQMQQSSGTPPSSMQPQTPATGANGVTYAPSDATQAPGPNGVQGATQAPEPIQTTPVPVGVQTLPPPEATAVAAPVAPVGPAAPSMAVPGPGAFVCTSDAQCLLGRCNMRYGRCAYPCRSSALDCKTGNVCTAAGLCMPRIAGGVGM